MSITVSIAPDVSNADFLQVEALVEHLTRADHNFKGRAITVKRGAVTFVADTDDILRGALLRIMVESILK
ncbi:hypothetical protein LJR129_003591 [Acidovorax sp. LjRoot129]|uniref:hypothetical protein n=1 Tax=Acidovorax sp. LjRoot129 TaxID=3342260 RepID=UPI003ED16618